MRETLAFSAGIKRRHKEGGPLDEAKKIANLPTSIQAKYNSLPNVAKKAVIK